MPKNLVNEVSKQIVHTTSLFKMDDSFQDERFCKVRVAAMHSGINRNQSRFSKECIEKAKDTFKNIPVLADIREYEDEEGNKYLDYAGHTMHEEDDRFNTDQKRIIYDEKVVGVIPETNNFEMVYDQETGNWYAYVDALLYREYGNYCCDILEERGGKTDVSMEIGCDNVSYSAKDKCLDVGVMTACATTLLGDCVTPGMAKAHAEMFSMDSNSRENQLMTIMQELKESLDNYTNFMKGGTNEVENENINLEAAENTEDTVVVTESSEEEATVESTTEEATVENDTEDTTDVTPDDNTEDVTEPEAVEQNSLKCSIAYGENVKEFAVSLSDIQYALSELVNTTYADEESYYGVEVFMEDKYVIMQDYWTGKAYKQSYKVKKDSYTLHGDRVPVKAVYLTSDEEAELDKMRSNYASLEQFKADTESAKLHADREAIMTNEKYSVVANTVEKDGNQVFENEAYAALYADMDKYSCEELEEKLKAIVGEYALSGKMEFSAKPEKKTVNRTALPINTNTKKKSRYGNLFEGIL